MRLYKTTIPRQWPHRLSALTLIVSLAFFSMSALASELHHTLRFTPGSVVTDTVASPDGTPYLRLYADDCSCIGEPGAPELPYRTISFHVPLFSKDVTVVVEASTVSETRSTTIPLWPVQEPVSANDWNATHFTAPCAEAYAVTPPSAMVTRDFLVNGDQRVISVSVAAALPEPDTSELNLLSSVSVCLKFAEGTADEMDFVPVSGPASSNDIDLSGLVVNPPAKPLFIEEQEAAYSPVSANGYYILAPEYLKESVHDIAMWKCQIGFNVEVKTYEEILSDTDCIEVGNVMSFDPESHVRNWLINEKKRVGTFNLLIIGDEIAGAPIRKFRAKTYDPSNKSMLKDSVYHRAYNGEYYNPTDMYFSDMTSKFVFDEDLFDCISGKEYHTALQTKQSVNPCLPVGRILGHKASNLKAYFRKLLIYENDPGAGHPEYLGNAMVFRQYDMIDEPSMFEDMSCFEDAVIMDDECNLDSWETNRPTGKEVIDVLKICGAISMKGHGSPFTIRCAGMGRVNDDWKKHRYIVAHSSYGTSITGHPNIETGNAFDCMNNFYHPAIAYSMSCTVCPFEKLQSRNGTYPDSVYNLGSSFTVAGDYGGVAFIGNTRDGYIGPSDRLEKSFGLYVNSGNSIGNSLVLSSNDNPSSKHCVFTRNLIGDPSIKMWLGVPEKMDMDITITSNGLYMKGKDVIGSTMAIFNGKECLACNSIISMPMGESVDFMKSKYGNDFTITFRKDGKLPYTTLIADQSNITNERKSYYFREMTLKNMVSEGKSCFKVGAGGKLDITSIRNLSTDKALTVSSDGKVSMTSMTGSITLKGDAIENGGSLNINAGEVLFEPGFCVNAGGKLEVNTKM